MKSIKGVLRFCAVCILLAYIMLPGSAIAQDLVILHTNDTHSQITPQITGEGKGLGGYERREAYINQVRKEHKAKNVLLLDGGDFSQGSPYFSLFKGDASLNSLYITAGRRFA